MCLFSKPVFPHVSAVVAVYMCEEKAECTKGFVLQIQQGVTQVAEEKQAKWLKVPRIAVISIEAASIHVGGVRRAKK